MEGRLWPADLARGKLFEQHIVIETLCDYDFTFLNWNWMELMMATCNDNHSIPSQFHRAHLLTYMPQYIEIYLCGTCNCVVHVSCTCVNASMSSCPVDLWSLTIKSPTSLNLLLVQSLKFQAQLNQAHMFQAQVNQAHMLIAAASQSHWSDSAPGGDRWWHKRQAIVRETSWW